MTKRWQFTAKFKFQVAQDALKGTLGVPETVNEVASQHTIQRKSNNGKNSYKNKVLKSSTNRQYR